MVDDLQERLTHLLEPVVEALGYELLLLEFVAGRSSGTLRLFIDSDSGIGLDDCERVSREVAAVLDVEDPITVAYRLEVSSPGWDRPLVKPAHFRRFVGERVRVQMLVPVDGQRRFSGVLADCDEQDLQIETESGTVRLSLAQVERARLAPGGNPSEHSARPR
jgi:Uncharacterized protein conserved in bacteria